MPTVRIQDVDLFYESKGQGDPIVFVPGLGTGGQIWDRVVLLLVKDYQCITLDNRGAGLSGVSEGPYTVPLLAQDARHLLYHLGHRNPTVVGHSMGGFIALTLSLEIPLHRAVLISQSLIAISEKQFLLDSGIKRHNSWQQAFDEGVCDDKRIRYETRCPAGLGWRSMADSGLRFSDPIGQRGQHLDENKDKKSQDRSGSQ